MNEFWSLVFTALSGFGLGLFFYGGLYFTVNKGLKSQRPALWFFGSLILRMSLVLVGFYLISEGDWLRLLICLAWFVVAGILFQFWKKTPLPLPIASESGDQHNAP